MREIKLRTPVKCDKGHFNYLYYSVTNGYVKDVRFAYPLCECNNAEGYKPCGDDELWTGLTDLGDKNIYEGDYVKVIDSLKWMSDPIAGIIYVPANFLWKMRDGKGTYVFDTFEGKKVVVVGNIHEGVDNATN